VTGFSLPIFSIIELAKQSKAVEAGLQLLCMVGQWWAQSQAAACILSQVLSNLRAVSQKPVMFRPVSDEWYGSATMRFIDAGNGFGE
jgi:predicted DCC family thiol-disulfide oxidoreductase YuxK